MKSGLKYHIVFIVLCAAIFVESSLPSNSYPDLEFEFADKFVHIGIFFVLSISAYLSFIYQRKFEMLNKYSMFFVILFATVYGASDELHQYFVPGRSCDVFDWIADVIGATVAVLVIIFLKKLFKNKNTILKSDYDTN